MTTPALRPLLAGSDAEPRSCRKDGPAQGGSALPPKVSILARVASLLDRKLGGGR